MQEQPPEQVQAQPPHPIQPQEPVAVAEFEGQTNTLAIVSLICGIISWFAVPVVGGVVAVVTGHMAKGQIRRTGEQGNTFASIGLILGYLHLAVVALILLALVLLFLGVFAAVRTTSGG
jgi:hypothetical protein